MDERRTGWVLIVVLAAQLVYLAVQGAKAGETRLDISLTYQPLRTNLNEALRALMSAPNTKRIRGELIRAAREVSAAPSAAAR